MSQAQAYQSEPTAAPQAAVVQAQAQAQDEPESLTEIVVTAQRRSENLQRAAIAVTAVGAESLRSANVTTPSQLTTLAPSLQASSIVGAFNTYIRSASAL